MIVILINNEKKNPSAFMFYEQCIESIWWDKSTVNSSHQFPQDRKSHGVNSHDVNS